MDVYEALIEERKAGRASALATIVNVVGSIPGSATAKMLVREDGSIVGTVGGGPAEAEVMLRAREVIESGKPQMISFKLRENPDFDMGMVCGGSLDIYVEAIVPKPVVYVFGGGHVGYVTERAARLAGFDVVVADDRQAFANRERFPDAVDVLSSSFASIMERLTPNSRALIFIASRCHELDAEILKWAVHTPAGYIGMIGSKRKVVTVFNTLTADGVAPDRFDRVRAPVGLDIGADTPEEIAFSVVSEMIAHIRRADAALPLSRSMRALAERSAAKIRSTTQKDEEQTPASRKLELA
ncbi:XdhC family protein [Oryzibacter oryziterrae]|uniref:XdhC family protein n=1 Tax=Oryzibacter oryziterrae TaxID=2766474 RepID=UPI001F353779|nr:XdhC/CoxI family protein [Oryzibacter oryziterrae]